MPPFRGFTLIELATVIALAGIAALLALPSFASLLESERVTAASNRLVAEIQLARLGAVASGRRVVICGSIDGLQCSSSADWSGGTLRFEDVNRNFGHDAGEPVTGIIPASDLQGLRVASTAGRRSLAFNSDGLAAGANQTLRICSLKRQEWRQIVINIAGRPRTARPAKGSICPP
jgi:type IV fimbrial biogenesis protein FimT